MGSHQNAVKVLHYTAPLACAACFAGASSWSVCTLQSLDTHVSKKLKRFVLIIMAMIMLSCAGEAATITTQLVSRTSSSATHHENIYTLSELLVWLVMFTALWGSESHQWYPYYGTWILTLICDLVILGLNGQAYLSDEPLRQAQVAVHSLRILLAVLLLPVYFLLRSYKEQQDEEASPLLQPEDGASKNQQKAKTGYGSAASDESALATGNEDEATKQEKELKEKMDQLKERLKKEGNWFTYIKGFSVFFPMVWPSKRPLLQLNLAGVGICILIIRALNVLAPLQIGRLTDSLAAGLVKESFVILAFYIILGWLQSYVGIEGLREFLWLPVEQNALSTIETASYNHIMELSCDFHDEKQSGDLFTIMRQGNAVVGLLDTILYKLGPMAIDLVVACFYFYYLFDAYLVLIAVTVMILYFRIALTLSSGQSDLRRQINITQRRKIQIMYDTMAGWRSVSYFNRILHAQKTYETSVHLYQRAIRKDTFFWYYRYGIQNSLLELCGFAAFAYAAYSVVYEGKKIGTFVTLVTYWSHFTGQLPYFSSLQRDIMKQLVDSEQLLQLFQTQPNVQDGPNEFSFQSGLVEIDKIAFSYKEGNEIIKDLSFHARPGQTIALVGETGAGKSTILKLLFRFYDVTSGSISIDGQDIRDLTLASLREHIGVVPQDPTLFNDTIMANVRYAKLDATNDEVMEACKTAAIHEKIMSFKQGYASTVGERGVKLSGGELQRVAIARAVLKNPKIILLDEATSSVDSETEAKIQEGLSKLTEGRTTFVVAHRLSTVRNADRILVIQNGSILEQGTPRQLLKSKGKYYDLWAKQMGLVDNEQAGHEDATKASKAKSKTNVDKGKRKSTGDIRKDDYRSSLTEQDSSSSQDRGTASGLQNGTQAEVHSKSTAAPAKVVAQQPLTASTQITTPKDVKAEKHPLSKIPSIAPTLSKAAKAEQLKQKAHAETRDNGKSNKAIKIKEPESAVGKFVNGNVGSKKSVQPQIRIDDASKVNEKGKNPATHGETTANDSKSPQAPGLEGGSKTRREVAQNNEIPLSKAVRAVLNQRASAVLQGRDLPSLSSIQEKEEEALNVESPAAKSEKVLLGRKASDAGHAVTDVASNKQGAPEKPDPKEASESKGTTSLDSTVQAAKEKDTKELSVAKSKAEKRSFSGRKKFKPRPDAPEFVPKGQPAVNKLSHPTQNVSSSQDTSQEFEGAMQETGNIKRNLSTRRLQAKSDPIGQSLKKIQDEWMAGLGENIATPDHIDFAEVTRPSTRVGGHVASRSTPFGSNRRRGRSRRRNNWASSTASENTIGSPPDAVSPSSIVPTPPMLIAPNTTPTGYRTPAGESPHQADGGVQLTSGRG